MVPVPSSALPLSALIASADKPSSSLKITAPALAPSTTTPAGAVPSNRSKRSPPSRSVSPATCTTTVALACPAAKLTVPDGSTLPGKSRASAGSVPMAIAPSTDQGMLNALPIAPPRVMVKVKPVVPALPSSFTDVVAATLSRAAGLAPASAMPSRPMVPPSRST